MTLKKQFVSVKAFSEIFDISEKTIYRKTLSGEIPSTRIFGRVRIPMDYVLELHPRLALSSIESDN